MKKFVFLYTASLLMFCFGIYLAQYRCYDASPLFRKICQPNGYGGFLPPIYSATFIFLSILIAVMTFIKQDDL